MPLQYQLHQTDVAVSLCEIHNQYPITLSLAQLVCALEYLHTELLVVHRDIKPENVLLTERVRQYALRAP